MSLNSDTLKQLADEVLTFIEQREAEQVAYGVYDVTMTGAEVIESFQPSEDIQLAAEQKTEAIGEALQQLGNDLQIIRFNKTDSPTEWVFRSRIAETVRLLTKLRQRIVLHNPEKEKHRISKSKRLVADVKFSVASRRVPRRNIKVRMCMTPLLSGNPEQQQTANLLLEVITTRLKKLRKMSGFQQRALHRILEAVELDAQEGIEKGVVVTASTGAGKTYAFFLPILAKMLLERCLQGREGVKAICIYPRVALSENQLTDFIEVLFYLNQLLVQHNLPQLTIGVESGAAVYQVRDFQDTSDRRRQQLSKMRGWTFSEESGGYLSPFAYCVGTAGHTCNDGKQRLLVYPTQPQTLACPACNKQYPFIQFARDVMKEHPPDLLIATTESLHRRLLSTKYQYLFGTDTFCAPSVVMLDEIHLQTSTSGSQVALLLRRLMARIRMGQRDRNEQNNLAFVGLSATIAEPIQFLSDLSGIPVTRIKQVTPANDEMQTIGAERYIFVRAEENEDTAIISTLIQTAMCVLHTMPQPPEGRYRTFGFVQSLDIVGRWLYQIEDAEKVKPDQVRGREREKAKKTPISERQIKLLPLYVYRFPPFNRQLFPNFLGSNFPCKRIHGFYALFDWLAYRAYRQRIELDLDELSRQGYEYLMEQTADSLVLLEFKDYLKRTFTIPDDAIVRVLGSETEGLLWSIFHGGLMKGVYPSFEKENAPYVKARKLLYKHLPENLFSDINLPEVRVDYRPDNHHPNKQPNSESISLAISETIPGNVTFRGGEGSTWIPPEVSEGEPTLISISQYYKFTRIDNPPNTVNLPVRALKKVDITPTSTYSLELYRPLEINPTQFSKDHNSSFWRCNPEIGDLIECRDSNEAPQDTQQLAHSTSANAISAVAIKAVRDTPTPAYTFTSSHNSLTCDPLSQALVERIVLYSDEPANLNLLDVRRVILGSEYTIKFHNSASDEIRGVVGFQVNEEEPTHCALGYQLLTDGVSIDLNPNRLIELSLSPSTQANLQSNTIHHAFITTLTVEFHENYFAAENLVNVLLTIADTWCSREEGTVEGLSDWFIRGNNKFEGWLTAAINEVHQLSKKKQEAVRQLVKSDNNYLAIFLDLYAEVYNSGLRYQQYLRDSFQYSLTQALKQVAQEVAGVEALNYVAVWTELKADFEERAADRIWLYEIGMGGIGVMRATHDLLRKQPDQFWTTLANKMTRCPTAQEEAFLRHLLSQSEEWLLQCETWVQAITTARKSSDRQIAIDRLLAEVRRQLGVPVRQAQLKSLLRVFIPDYNQEVDDTLLVNWRIFREINHEFLPDCAVELKRDPSFTEARAMLYRKIIKTKQQQSPYPESRRLLKLYETEYVSSNEDEARKAFEAAVERRMLLNCRCNCSSCLDDRSSDIESPGLSRNLLNRPLLTEWLKQVRTRQTLEVDNSADADAASVCDRIRMLLEEGCQAIYLRVKSDRLADLCTTISYLTDAGIDTDIGMVYPMITDIQTLYPNDLKLTESPVVEVTIRPIE